jgi:hypothetical protein
LVLRVLEALFRVALLKNDRIYSVGVMLLLQRAVMARAMMQMKLDKARNHFMRRDGGFYRGR